MSKRRNYALAILGLFTALLAAYSNHFENGFHFDDIHTIVENPAIRSLANIPRFFADARTFSHLSEGGTYRPLVSVSLALDYWLASGLHPFWFHFSTFVWYLVQLVLMHRLYLYVLDRTSPDPDHGWLAWFAVAIYALHPVSAETINYNVQRGDLYVSLGMVAGLVIYAWKPGWRRFGFYLLPPLAAMFSKAPALVFAPLLLLYILVVDRQDNELLGTCFLRAVPAFSVCAAFSCLEKAMTPAGFFHGTPDWFNYWITQPYVALRYFQSFFLPLHLNVDTDLGAFHSAGNIPAISGIVFCTLVVTAAVFAARRNEWRPVCFGLWWFLIGLIPTAIYPLNEVENDHRMFLPFIGLSLAVVWTVTLLVRQYAKSAVPALAAVGLMVLVAFSVGTFNRNIVWHTDESLWRDDIRKSPNNARGHDNLGVVLSAMPGRLPEAIREYQIALQIKPDYADAHLNLGKAFARNGGSSLDAIREFEATLRIDPNVAEAHVNLGVSFSTLPDRTPQVLQEFETALRIDPNLVLAHYDLGVVLSRIPGRLPDAIVQYQAALRIDPEFINAHRRLGIAFTTLPDRLPDAIREFEAALRLSPNSAEAHLNLGSALAQVSNRRAEAIAQYQAALRIKPDYAQARANLTRVEAEGGRRP